MPRTCGFCDTSGTPKISRRCSLRSCRRRSTRGRATARLPRTLVRAGRTPPDPDCLARDLQHISDRLGRDDVPTAESSYLKDRLGLLAARCQWVVDPQQRAFLEQQVDATWKRMGVSL